MNRRNFLNLGSLATVGGFASVVAACNNQNPETPGNAAAKATTSAGLKSMAGDAVPISVAERQSRVAKAQKLMTENKIAAILLDSGTSLTYFTGVKWGGSERTMVALIPASGDVKYVCPAFEHDRLKEQITIGSQIYNWEEDESPYQKIALVFKDYGISSGTIGIEERVRFFIADGVRKAAPNLNFESADPVTIACRIIKSDAEIKLMQKASDITVEAIKTGISQLTEGMWQSDLSSIINKAQRELGGEPDFALCLFAKASAFPHGLKEPQQLKKGDIVLMDCGCRVHGYSSDITRTIVFGNAPTKRQEEIWNLEKQSQQAGFAAAQIGKACETVDAAARKVIVDAGFGPGYKLPGLPHRTGHGIGMDGHEWGNMVKGNTKLLEAGMCFSIEPNISIVGEFGVRLEDCVYMTTDGPKWFSPVSKSITEPFG